MRLALPQTRHTGDFQITRDGNYASFTSTLPLTGIGSARHSEIFRFDAVSDTLTCVSCDPTGAEASGDSELASNGLSLTGDGRIFFSSTESLVERDGDAHKDVYEWEPFGVGPNGSLCQTSGGCLGLITTGLGASRLDPSRSERQWD